eukprot:g167.t1
MHVESLNSNWFLRKLRSPEHHDVWSDVRKNNLLVCVPQTCAFSGEVTRKDIENHVLRPNIVDDKNGLQTTTAGQYRAISGLLVTVIGNRIFVQEGIRGDGGKIDSVEGIEIIYTQEITIDSHFVQVIYINRPLVGGIEAPNGSDNMDQNMIQRFFALLWSHPGADAVFHSLDTFTKEIVRIGKLEANYSGLARIRPNLRICIKSRCKSATESLVLCTKHKAHFGIERVYWNQFHQVVESHVMKNVHSVVFPYICNLHRRSTAALGEAITEHAGLPLSFFGVPDEFRVSLSSAVELLEKLNSEDCKTPLEKAQCLAKASNCIRNEVENNVRSRRRKSMELKLKKKKNSIDLKNVESQQHQEMKVFTTDDLLCLIISAVVQAGECVHNLLANIAYIEEFHFVGVSTSALGFHMAHFQAAAEYLISSFEKTSKLPRTPK